MSGGVWVTEQGGSGNMAAREGAAMEQQLGQRFNFLLIRMKWRRSTPREAKDDSPPCGQYCPVSQRQTVVLSTARTSASAWVESRADLRRSARASPKYLLNLTPVASMVAKA